jgi:hypothetical protein
MPITKVRINTAKTLVRGLEKLDICLSAIHDISPTNEVYDVFTMVDRIFSITGKAGLDQDGFDDNIVGLLPSDSSDWRLTPDDMNQIYIRMISEGVNFYQDTLTYLGRPNEGFNIESLAVLKAASAGLLTATLYYDPTYTNRQERSNVFSQQFSELVSATTNFQQSEEALKYVHDQLNDHVAMDYPEDWNNGLNDLRHWLSRRPGWPEYQMEVKGSPAFPTA